MVEIKEFWAFLVIILIALVVTAIAAWKTTSDPTTKEKDFWGFPVWFTPLAYLMLAWLLGGVVNLNKPISVLCAFFAYGLSVFILFMSRRLPSTLQWYYPIGLAAIITIFFF